MRFLKSVLFLGLLLIYTNIFAVTIPNGDYQLVAVRCDDSQTLRYAKLVQYKDFSNLMIQAHVPGRESLNPYYFSYIMHKSNDGLQLNWKQLHTGNSTNDERNHAPFYVSFNTEGSLLDDTLVDMHLNTDSIKIKYLEKEFNGQEFTDADITDRMAKDKHLGAYTTRTNWTSLQDEQFPNTTLFELTEVDGGFGAPRHLLCGAVDAKMNFILSQLN